MTIKGKRSSIEEWYTESERHVLNVFREAFPVEEGWREDDLKLISRRYIRGYRPDMVLSRYGKYEIIVEVRYRADDPFNERSKHYLTLAQDALGATACFLCTANEILWCNGLPCNTSGKWKDLTVENLQGLYKQEVEVLQGRGDVSPIDVNIAWGRIIDAQENIDDALKGELKNVLANVGDVDNLSISGRYRISEDFEKRFFLTLLEAYQRPIYEVCRFTSFVSRSCAPLLSNSKACVA